MCLPRAWLVFPQLERQRLVRAHTRLGWLESIRAIVPSTVSGALLGRRCLAWVGFLTDGALGH